MAKKRIGLLVLGGYDWVGGLYYVLNLIKSLSHLPEHQKPEIVAFWGNDIARANLKEIVYPYLTLAPYNKTQLSRMANKALQLTLKQDLRIKQLGKDYNLDCIYPYNYALSSSGSAKLIAWFPDFQHKFLPHLFSSKEIKEREEYLDSIQSKIGHIVFSSEDARSHYEKFYPESQLKLYTLPFVSNINKDQLLKKEEVCRKYKIESDYFMVANQFWEHKNHLVVLEAVRKLREAGTNILMIFTGKEEDHRNPNYFTKIKTFVEDHVLEKQLKFLGFIDRIDQLSLLNNAKAIVQPSTFEGWGTVVEDAKTLNKQVIASNIPVHHEQLSDNAYFFEPSDSSALASILDQLQKGRLPNNNHYQPAESRTLQFAETFLKIIS